MPDIKHMIIRFHGLMLRDDAYEELCALVTASGASDSLVEAVHAATSCSVGLGVPDPEVPADA